MKILYNFVQFTDIHIFAFIKIITEHLGWAFFVKTDTKNNSRKFAAYDTVNAIEKRKKTCIMKYNLGHIKH